MDLYLFLLLPNQFKFLSLENSKSFSSMATSPSSSAQNPKFELIKKIRSHEVALAELDNLSSSRAVYQKTANLFFRTSIPKAKAAEQKNLDSAKAVLGKMNSS